MKNQINLSVQSLQEFQKKLQKIESRLKSNIKLATMDLMETTYELLIELYKNNNLKNHINTLHKEIISDGNGFRIWTNDWIVIFNEYGTGIIGSGTHPNSTGYQYNLQSQYKDKYGRWVYFNKKTESFITTKGMKAKHMYYDAEQIIKKYIGEYYNYAITCSVNDEQYQKFRNSLKE